MASGDVHDDIDRELHDSVREVNLYVEELRGKITKFYREKKKMEHVQKRLVEISMEYHKSEQKDKDGIRKRLNELKTEFYNIKDFNSSDLDDLGVAGGGGRDGASRNDAMKRFFDIEKEQLEDVEKRLNELSMECHQLGIRNKDGIWKRLDELKIELDIIKDIRSISGLEFDLQVGGGIGGPGPSQDDPRKRLLDKEKEQLEAVEKKVIEFLKEYHQSNDSGKKDKEGFWKRLDELRTELDNIKDIGSSGLDVGVIGSGSGGAGPSQDVGEGMSKSGGQDLEGFRALLDFIAFCYEEMNRKKKQQQDIRSEDQDLEEVSSSLLDLSVGQGDQQGCKTDDVKTAGIEGNQSCESSNAEGCKDVFDVTSDSTLAEGVFFEGLEPEVKNFTRFMEEERDIEKKFLDEIAKSESSVFPEQPVSSDAEGISTNIEGQQQEVRDAVQEMEIGYDSELSLEWRMGA